MNKQTFGTRQTENLPNVDFEWHLLMPIFRSSMLWMPERQAPSYQIEHVPFAFWLVDVLRPRRIIELGTYTGVFYSALCQSVKSLRLATSCFAIDTRKGEYSEFYSDDDYRDFIAFHDQRYGTFSRLVRSSFDEALPHFEDGSIDLLNIDGVHTFEAVQHDYRSWLPKLSPNAIVLFHNTNVREREFGVFRLWNEIAAERPHFSFLHEHGLGVLGQGRDYSGALGILFDANANSRLVSSIREIFGALGRSVRALSEKPALDQSLSEQITEIGALRQVLAGREDELAASKQELSKSTTEIGTLRQALAVREVELAAFRQGLSRSTSEIGILRQALAARERELATFSETLAELETHVKALDAKISAPNTSTSWRITAPLRAARRLSEKLYYSRLGHPFALAWRASTTLSLAPLRDWRAERVIARSQLFDKDWYLTNNLDVSERGINPVWHYVAFGAREGRDPSPSFSTTEYLANNPDIAAAGVNPLAHFILYGAAEGRTAPRGLRTANFSQAAQFSLKYTPGSLDQAEQPTDGINWLRPLVVIIDSVYPKPDQDSGSVDTVNFVRIFRDLGYQVAFAADGEFSTPSPYRPRLESMGVIAIRPPRYQSIGKFLETVGPNIDVCVLSRVHSGGRYIEQVRRQCPYAKVIFNTVDLHHLREERQARLKGDRTAFNLAQGTREREVAITRLADATIVVSRHEEELLSKIVPGAAIHTVPLIRETPGNRKWLRATAGGWFHRRLLARAQRGRSSLLP